MKPSDARDGSRRQRRFRERCGLLASPQSSVGALAPKIGLADSGDFPEVTDGATTYIVPPASCGDLQDIVGPIEFALACSIGDRQANAGPGDTPCDVVTFNNQNAGLALGQCLTTLYPNPLLAVLPNIDVIKPNTQILSTAAGSNVAFGNRDQLSITNGAAVQGYVDVSAGPSVSGGTCNGIPVISGTTQAQSACDFVANAIGQSITGTPPPLSHVAFFDLDRTGTTSGSIAMKVAVCNGYTWSCRAPGATVASSGNPPAKVDDTTYRGQVPFAIVNTPLCLRLNRYTGC